MDSILSISTLKELYANDNAIPTVPAAIGRLAMLRILNLARNSIQSLPTEFGGASKLLWLSLAGNGSKFIRTDPKGNQLEVLPPSIINLVELEQLFLSNNKLTTASFPKGVESLKRLRVVDLSANLIDVVPQEFAQLPVLAVFELAANPLAYPPKFYAYNSASSIQLFMKSYKPNPPSPVPKENDPNKRE